MFKYETAADARRLGTMTSDLQEIVELLRNVPTAALSGYLYKKQGMRTRTVVGVGPLDPGRCRFVGPAYTIRYIPQREDLNAPSDLASTNSVVLKVMEEIPKGHVLVMDMQRQHQVGGLGDVLVSNLIHRGVAGVVADGGMRDVRELREMTLPIFCAGAAAPPSPAALMPVAVQQPIACGGVAVFPDDLIVADEDGVIVVPPHLARSAATEAAEKERLDAWVRQQVAGGSGVRGLYPPDAEHLEMYRKSRGG